MPPAPTPCPSCATPTGRGPSRTRPRPQSGVCRASRAGRMPCAPSSSALAGAGRPGVRPTPGPRRGRGGGARHQGDAGGAHGGRHGTQRHRCRRPWRRPTMRCGTGCAPATTWFVRRMPCRRRRRGRPQAALVVDLADGDSMSAGESLSRVQMFRLGSASAAAAGQARGRAGADRHTSTSTGTASVGEFDGKVKYRVPADA
jgi:hypothetical protein